MDKNFDTYFSGLSAQEKKNLASNADTSVAYLSQVASGHRNAGASLIRRLMAADNSITFEMMAPKDAA